MGLVAADARHRLSKLIENRARAALQHLPRLGQQQLSMTTFEKRHAKLLFQRLDLTRQR